VRKLAALAISAILGATGASAGHYIITSSRQIRPSVLRQIEAEASEKTPPTDPASDSERCAPGEQAVSGAYEWAGPGHFELTGTYPRAGDEWVIEGRYWGGGGQLSVQVVCRSVS
jgi:hypothetical protein